MARSTARDCTNEFTRAGYLFLGWATATDGAVAYEPDAAVTNLTAVSGGVVALYAVWEQENVSDPVVTPADGTIFRTPTCTVTTSCETPGATIYYTTNGRTPSARPAFQYNGPFEIAATATIVAFAVKGEKQSGYVEATPPTKPGLVYTLREGAQLTNMANGASTVGDGQPWTPAITVKGGKSGFYSIRVTK